MRNFIKDTANRISVKLTDPAQEFVINRVAVNGATSMPLEDEGDSEELEHDQPTNETVQHGTEEYMHCKHFAEALQSFEDSLPESLKTGFNLQSKHTWAEVISEAKCAEIKYNKKADKESPFGRVRGFFRSLRSNSPAIQNWLSLLPSDSMYGSLICGGIKVILRAATRMDEIKEFIVGAMAAIPEEVDKAQLLIQYNTDQDVNRRLYKSVSSLYYAVFGILNHIIVWYRKRSIKRHAKAILYQETYEKDLETKVDSFKRAIMDVKSEAEICGFRRLQTVDERTQGQSALLEEIVQLLRSNPNIDFRTGQFRQYPFPIEGQPVQKRRAISRQSLCEAVLRYDEDVPRADLATILHSGSNLSLKGQDRIVYVIENEALQTWLLNSKNAALLIRGNSEHLESDEAAISFVAAHLVQSTQKAQHTSRLVGLFWFTKQHQNKYSDPDANVHGIMRSLIGQLVYAYGEFDLYFIKRSHAMAMRDNNDVKTLCDVFDNLVYQLPERAVVFCTIDGLSCLEYGEKHEVQYLVQRLLSIVRHTNENGSLFKLLLTHAGGAFRAASTFVGRGEILDVPEDGNGNGMGFTKLMWDGNVDDKLRGLGKRAMR
ncbi:hypothetical protein O1611_g590 [Lasiodiplodia mahajangana]|uniref:Uncharacterized protein n=1 Tax=Lasiodiplodia mahajangana TaxID=1108764 RepID=A0ACC2K016_9PEZI|nr:hypothetical protein O1611_g590 [Lasiodiplodia mahajangana]